jgi:hypothetical protein
MIFGWGNGVSTFAIPKDESQYIKTTFWYFHIMLILRITLNRKWILVIKNKETANAEAVISKEKVDQLMGYDPVNIFWCIFNQSLVVFILGSMIWSGINGHKYSPYRYYQNYVGQSSISSSISS